MNDLAAFRQSHSPHSRDFGVRRNQAFNPYQVYLPFGTLEEEKMKTESLLQSQQSMTFPKKAQIPLVLFALVRQSVSFSIWEDRTSKTLHCCQAFPLFHLRYLHSLVFLHFLLPVQQQLVVTQAYPAQSGAGSVYPSPWQHRAFHSSQSTLASIPETPIHYLGKYKLLNLRVGFPEDSQGQALGNRLNWAPSSKCPNTKTF